MFNRRAILAGLRSIFFSFCAHRTASISSQFTRESSQLLRWRANDYAINETPHRSWQFRWVSDDQVNGGRWSVKDVYIGPMCPSHCNGHGDCVSGECQCDDGYRGFSCQPSGKLVPSKFPLLDNFDNTRPASLWHRLDGASIRVGCGVLIPHSHGRHLHFDGCSARSATTLPIDVAKISHMAFVLRTGTPQQLPTCRIHPVHGNSTTSAQDLASNRAILLQYSFDGVQWLLLASHLQRDFIQPRRLLYNIPSQFRHPSIQFRWWQARHGGSTWDQWALDNVEFLP